MDAHPREANLSNIILPSLSIGVNREEFLPKMPFSNGAGKGSVYRKINMKTQNFSPWKNGKNLQSISIPLKRNE